MGIPMTKRMISTREAARLLGVTTRTLECWADSGLVPCVRSPSGRRRFRIHDLEHRPLRQGPSRLGRNAPSALLEQPARADEERLRQAMDEYSSARVRRMVVALHAKGESYASISDRLLVPAFEHAVAQVAARRRPDHCLHLTSNCLVEVLALLVPRLRQHAGERRLLCMPLASPQTDPVSAVKCDMLARLVSVAAWEAGFEVFTLGTGLPLAQIRKAAAVLETHWVAVAGDYRTARERHLAYVSQVFSVTRRPRQRLLCVGPGATDMKALPRGAIMTPNLVGAWQTFAGDVG